MSSSQFVAYHLIVFAFYQRIDDIDDAVLEKITAPFADIKFFDNFFLSCQE